MPPAVGLYPCTTSYVWYALAVPSSKLVLPSGSRDKTSLRHFLRYHIITPDYVDSIIISILIFYETSYTNLVFCLKIMVILQRHVFLYLYCENVIHIIVESPLTKTLQSLRCDISCSNKTCFKQHVCHNKAAVSCKI